MSLIDTLKVRMDAVFELGEKLENQLDAAKEEAQRYMGAENALDQAIRGIDDLQKHIEKDLEEGKLDPAQFEGEPMKLAAFIKSWVLKARGCVNNLHVGAKVNTLLARGKQEALETSVKHAKGMFDVCNAKLEAIKTGVLAAEPEGPTLLPDGHVADVLQLRKPGTHPGDPLAARRSEAVGQAVPKSKKAGKAKKKAEPEEHDGPHAG